MKFEHIGLITEQKKAAENFVESTQVWVTDPKEHPFHVEWLRYEPDSPIRVPVRERAHVAYSVDNLQEASKGLRVLLEPFEVGGFARIGFYEYQDGAVVELMEYIGGRKRLSGRKTLAFRRAGPGVVRLRRPTPPGGCAGGAPEFPDHPPPGVRAAAAGARVRRPGSRRPGGRRPLPGPRPG